jgi:SpoVK/Ycf46/Vps4 family AAA+-type ATPase
MNFLPNEKLTMVPYYKSFSCLLRTIGKCCDVDIVYVGKNTAIKYNLQFGTFCSLKPYDGEETVRNNYDDQAALPTNCLIVRIYIDHRVEDETILLSNYIMKHIFPQHKFIQLVPQHHSAAVDNFGIAKEINVSYVNSNTTQCNTANDDNRQKELFKEYIVKHGNNNIPVNIGESNVHNRILIKQNVEHVIISYIIAPVENCKTDIRNSYIYINSSTKINFLEKHGINVNNRNKQIKNEEDDKNSFSIKLVNSIKSLNTLGDNILDFIHVHTNKLTPGFKNLLPRFIILYGSSGSGRTSICQKVKSKLKETYGPSGVIYSSIISTASAISRDGSTGKDETKFNALSLNDIYIKISKMDIPYILILDHIDHLFIDRNDAGVAMKNATKYHKNQQTLLIKIIDITVQSKLQSFIICTANNKFKLDYKLIKPDRLGRIFNVGKLTSEDRLHALEQFMIYYNSKNAMHNSPPRETYESTNQMDMLKVVSNELTDGFVLKHLANVVKSAYFKHISLEEAANMIKLFIHHDVTKILIPTKSFSSIGGYKYIKQRLLQVNQSNTTASNKDGKKNNVLRTKRVTGILLHGPSGCGKTKFVEAFAHETNSYLIVLRASALLSPYLGESERALRETFKNASMSSKSILFIDEIDALIPSRSFNQNSNSNSSSIGIGERLLSTLLNCMDGLIEDQNVLVIAATTRIDMVDPALRRPGRLGTCIEIPFPTNDDILEIFHLYMSKYGLINNDNYTENITLCIPEMVSNYFNARKELKMKEQGVDMHLNLEDKNEQLTGAIIESICRGEAMNFLRNRINIRIKQDNI